MFTTTNTKTGEKRKHPTRAAALLFATVESNKAKQRGELVRFRMVEQ